MRYITNKISKWYKIILDFFIRHKVVIVILIALGGYFYWFEWRPTEIKKDCSYRQRFVDAIPELTQAQIDTEKDAYDSCIKKYPSKPNKTSFDSSSLQDIFGPAISPQCVNIPNGYGKTPHPAYPAKIVYDPVNSTDYTFCLHAHGI